MNKNEWTFYQRVMERPTPQDFNFDDALAYLGRSDQDILQRIQNGSLYKLIRMTDENYLINVSHGDKKLRIDFLTNDPNEESRSEIGKMIWEAFDLDRDLHAFYQLAEKDPILSQLVQKYCGLRIVGIDDLFEAITWAIIGQQINLTFAYTLKKRLIETFGESMTYNGKTYWLFPTALQLSALNISDLTDLQFTTRKAEYVIGVARMMASGELTKRRLQNDAPETILKKLVAIRGIGHWTAQYVMMRCFHIPSAFPISDVGLHNALKAQLKLSKKPTIEEIERMALGWKGFEAYATFYLWRSLYD